MPASRAAWQARTAELGNVRTHGVPPRADVAGHPARDGQRVVERRVLGAAATGAPAAMLAHADEAMAPP